MNELLKRLLAAHAENGAEGLRQVLGDSAEDFAAARTAAIEAFAELQTNERPTSDDVTRMEVLADIGEALAERIEADVAQADRVRLLAERMDRSAQVQEPAPAEPAAAPNDVQPDGDQPNGGEAAPAAVEPAAPGGDGEVLEGELVTAGSAQAAARQAPMINLGRMPQATVPTDDQELTTYSVSAAADIPGISAGAELQGLEGIGDALVKRMTALSRVGPGKTVQAGIATLHRNAPATFTADTESDFGVIDRAVAERRLPGGSLVAAANCTWCAESEVLYDMCDTASRDGLIDLPTVTARRGGIKWPVPPTFKQIYDGTANLGFRFPENRDAACPPKACVEIPCPTYVDTRLSMEGLCITTPLLVERAWPEWVTYFVEQVMVAHAHKINAWTLAQMQAQAVAVPIPPPAAEALPAYGPGATAAVLGAVELMVEQLRYKFRMPRSTTFEAVLPYWARPVLRSDLAKRNGVDMITVTDAQLDAHLRGRGIRPQYVWDWQDAGAQGGVQTDMGGNTWPVVWPGSVKIMIYPAGAYFRMSADVITIDGVYDSTGLKANEYTRLFTEEGVAVSKRCWESVLLTVPLDPSGATGVQQAVAVPSL